MRFIWVACVCVLGTVTTVRSQDANVSKPYNQWDPQQTELRDVAFVSPSVVHANATATSLLLEVKVAVNHFNGIRLRHRSYNGNLTGPTIRVRPGTKLRICLENNLPNETSTTHDDENLPHGFNNTNLHTHGLHVSPKSPSDNVFLEIAPNTKFDFEFDIEPDHPTGTFWYHPHKHGSTAYQLASGMAGALIVEGGLDDHPGLTDVDERIMVLQQFVYRENQGDAATVNVDDVYEMLVSPQTAINGQATPTITMRPGEIQRWRLIHAGIGEALELSLKDVPLYEIAVDGLALGTRVTRSSIQLYPGYRSDVLIKAPSDAGTYLLTTEIKDPKKSLRRRIVAAASLLKLVVAGPPKEMQLPTPESFAPYAAFKDADVPTDQQISGRTTLRFKGDSPKFYINDEQFQPTVIKRRIPVETAEEWTITGEMGGHPFHVHVNPFAVPVEAGDGNPNKWLWRDTLFVDDSQSVKLRSWFRKHTGQTVLHCHILDHEDQGMMQVIEIEGSAGVAETINRPLERVADTRLAGTRLASNIELQDSLASKIATDSWLGKKLLLVLHRGFGCVHCAQQIRELAAQSNWLKAQGIQVVAVSQEIPVQPELELLRKQWAIDFPVLSDRNLDLFKALKCLEVGKYPLHGTYYFDAEGVLLCQHIGEEPLMTFQSFVGQADSNIMTTSSSQTLRTREGE